MTKRKRAQEEDAPGLHAPKVRKEIKSARAPTAGEPITIQIVTGSYERVLHGFTARLPANYSEQKPSAVQFSDTFLFNAHTSSIRCLALSPPSADDSANPTRYLATGSTDERINVYALSTTLPNAQDTVALPIGSKASVTIAQNPRNRSLGHLLHHSRNISALHFPNRSKLFSGADDNTVAIARTRDWTVLTSVKAPKPRAVGRPSGDTATADDVPSGINDFAVHPSLKLMISVSKGEKCMRLWNLITAKKANVLNFDRETLASVGEGRYGRGEGQRILWNADGEEFVIGFERGACIFGMDAKPKARILPAPLTKIHQVRYLPCNKDVLAVSTEDGRILFCSTDEYEAAANGATPSQSPKSLPSCKCLAQLGGHEAGSVSRIKDFEMLCPESEDAQEDSDLILVSGGSDGTVRVWLLRAGEVPSGSTIVDAKRPKQVGTLLEAYETGNRITCLTAFVMGEAEISGSDSDRYSDIEENVDDVATSDSTIDDE